jgi:succinate dehydrogenase/fumarate reductase flavoprotein subunit
LTLTVAGAGMSGLVAAARVRELGADVTVYEKGDRAGGSMLLSSGVVWRHRDFHAFRGECPAGDERLQRLIWDRFDDAIAWLETTTGVAPVWDDTENPRTTGRRYAPAELAQALLDCAGAVRLNEPFPPTASPLVLATGGFPVRLAREHGLLVRSNRWSEGNALDHARTLGAGLAGDLGEFYGRVMPAPPARIAELDFVRLSQLYGGHAVAVDDEGRRIFEGRPAWHESDIAQAVARQPGGTAWYSLPRSALDLEALRSAREAGATLLDDGNRLRIRVIAGVTHTLGGLKIDERARVLREDGSAIEGLYAAGVDVGGIASGGYASGLAQALVLGLVAAEELAQ